MLDIKFIRENPDLVKENIKKRFQTKLLGELDELLNADKEYRKLLKDVEDLRHSRNIISKEINKLKKKGEDIKAMVKRARDIPDRIKKAEEKLEKAKAKIKNILPKIPNMIATDVPLGKDESENKVIKKWGKIRKFTFPIRNHVELMEMNGWADFDASAKTSGSGFYFLKGELALLNQALIRFAIDFMVKRGYKYIEPPLMLKKNVLAAALDVEEFKKTIYDIKGEDLSLIGTSEYSLLGMLTGRAIPEQELPLKLVAYSMCFRKEIGSHGINEKGLWRTHQFNKVEHFVFCAPEESHKFYLEMRKNAEDIYQALEIPYRLLEICSGDLSTWKHKSEDIEAYRPTIKDYGEVGSLTNCTTYQAQDLGIKIIKKNGTREVLHTLNNTALATSRAMVAILENNQNDDGSVTIPKVLVPYMNGVKKIGGKNKKPKSKIQKRAKKLE